MPISYETYKRVTLEDGDEQWELVCGHLRKKPGMTIDHRTVIIELTVLLHGQLRKMQFVVSANHTRLRAGDSYYVPDLVVIPREVQNRA
ncbi:MAG TPA: Uma2 family endonuclease, partial [Dehalococcoidia bacterium]